MKYIGLDIGTVYTGIAISEYGDLATALRVIPASELIEYVKSEFQKNSDMMCVVGIPRTETVDNNNTKNIENYVTKITALGIPVVVVDETNTTGFAISLQTHANAAPRGQQSVKRSDRMDAASAAMILQRYLDTQKPARSILDDRD